jgi:YGGT family
VKKMTEIVKESITTQNEGPKAAVTTEVKRVATSLQTVEYLIYFCFGALEILLAFRLVLKLLGASMSSAFVGFIYGLTGIFILPFEGIFRRGFAQGVETASVLEPSTLVALIVYAVLAWGLVKLLRIFSGEKQAA